MIANKPRPSRRRFLTSAGLGLLTPSFITKSALGAAGQPPPSQRVVAGLIGCGGRGTGLLSIQGDPRCTIAAVCDGPGMHR